MISRLYLDNCFTHQDQTFHFDKGLTGVTGPNESGKSLIVEMIRYALFGSAALRGKGEDYKKLHVELDFTVAGEDYTVLRKGTKVELTGGRQASGTKPVNEAIRSVLGYDLAVFDVANACNQGNIEALSDMTPTARKAMVDKTIGLDQLDQLIKLCGSEGNTLKREAEAIKGTLVEPVKPEGEHRPSEEVRAELDQARVEAKEAVSIESFLRNIPPVPQSPGDAPVAETSVELSAYQERRRDAERQVKKLTHQISLIEPEEFDEYELQGAEAAIEMWDMWRQKERLLAQGHICCPECKHEWPVADLGDLADVEEPLGAAPFTQREINEHRARIGNKAQKEQLEVELAGIVVPEDRSAELAQRQEWEARVAVFERQQEAYHGYNAAIPEKQARLEELFGIHEAAEGLEAEFTAARDFERDTARYTRDLETHLAQVAKAAELEDRSSEFLKAREIIQALKVSVKTHLLPSLNKVASVLLSQMTGGERYLVEVDEEFEITIDGQAIGTLSGSGKAVANLAIRIALGQILTNRVFSIFLADEVDAAMDDERAGHTADALRRLTDLVSQVVLVTHKRPETDHQIELKK